MIEEIFHLQILADRLLVVNPKNVYVEAEVAERYANILKVNTPVMNFKTLGIDKEAPLSFVGQVINPENLVLKLI